MKIFMDASFLVALTVREDINHVKAEELMRKFGNNDLYFNDLIKYETINVILRKNTVKKAMKINSLLEQKSLNKILITDDIWNEVLVKVNKKYSKSGPNIFDYIHFTCMSEYDITNVLTFDNHFGRFGFKILN